MSDPFLVGDVDITIKSVSNSNTWIQCISSSHRDGVVAVLCHKHLHMVSWPMKVVSRVNLYQRPERKKESLEKGLMRCLLIKCLFFFRQIDMYSESLRVS